MQRPILSIVRLAWGIALLAAGAMPARGDWHTSLPGGPRGLRSMTLVNDGAGGVLTRWVGLEGQVYSPWAYVGHVDLSGASAPGWPGSTFYPAVPWQDLDVAPDGEGGAIIVTSSSADILAYHVRADGALDPGWSSAGLLVCGDAGEQVAPRTVSDGAGGAYISWRDLRDGTATAYLTRVTANGALASGWPANGKRLGTWPPNSNGIPDLLADGAGGAIVGLVGTDGRLFRFAGDGLAAPGWSEAGLFVTTSATAPNRPRLAVASDAGCYLAWTEGSATPLPLRSSPVRAFRITPDGLVDSRWPAGGLTVAPGTDSFSDPAIAADVSGGIYLVWGVLSNSDARSLRGARLSGNGSFAPGWAASGNDLLVSGASLTLDNSIYEFEDPAVFAAGMDGTGGLFVAWDDRSVSGTTQVRVSRFLSDGTRHPSWPDVGHLVPAASGNGRIRTILGSGTGYASVAWRSISSPPFGSTMLSQVGPDDVVDVEPAPGSSTLNLASGSGNPARGEVVFVCSVPGTVPARLELYDVNGRRLRSRTLEGVAGRHRVVVAGRGELPQGIVFARLAQGSDERRLRVVVTR